MKKFWIVIAVMVALVLGAAGAGAYLMVMQARALAVAGAAVRVERVSRGNLVEVVSAPGQIQPRTKVSISARIAARIDSLPAKEGDRVKAGDLLVRLDATEMEASLHQAEARTAAEESGITVARERLGAEQAQIEVTRISLADAQRDLGRQKELLATRDVSQSTVDQAQAKYDGLRAQILSAEAGLRANQANISVLQHNLEAAQAEIKRSRDVLAYTTITSPIDGVVTKVNAKVGEVVMTGTMNNAGTVILEVADLSQMIMEARVGENSVSRVEKGQNAVVRIQAYADEPFAGVVDTVALSHTDDRDGSKYFKTEVLLKEASRKVLAGLTADVDIETHRHEGVLKVPTQAVVSRRVADLPADVRNRPEVDSSKTLAMAVFRLMDGKATLTPVTIGASDDTHTMMKAGLDQNETIIVGPYRLLETLEHGKAVHEDAPATRPATQPATKPAEKV